MQLTDSIRMDGRATSIKCWTVEETHSAHYIRFGFVFKNYIMGYGFCSWFFRYVSSNGCSFEICFHFSMYRTKTEMWLS